jgi:hypothetical protein
MNRTIALALALALATSVPPAPAAAQLVPCSPAYSLRCKLEALERLGHSEGAEPLPVPAAPSRETLLRQQMKAREDARGWRSFGNSTYYAWKEWKLIAPGVRATAYKLEPEPSSGGGIPLAGLSGRVSVSCPTLAWRYWEPGGFTRWGRPGKPAQWGGWINAGSPESTPSADAMVAALCANVSGAAPAGQGGR